MSRRRFTVGEIIGVIAEGRSKAFPGQERRSGLPGDGDHGADLLSVA